MPEEPQQQAGTINSGNPPAEPPAGALNTDTAQPEIMIPKTRFDEVNRAKQDAEAKIEQYERERREAEAQRQRDEQERLKKQGEFQTLYETAEQQLKAKTTELETATAEITRLRTFFDAMKMKRLESAPDHIKALLQDMDAVKALEWLDANADKLAPAVPPKPTPPNLSAADGTHHPRGRDVLTDKEEQMLKAFPNLTREQLIKSKGLQPSRK